MAKNVDLTSVFAYLHAKIIQTVPEICLRKKKFSN